VSPFRDHGPARGGAVVFLQNSWHGEFAGRADWPRADWLATLSRSRSGQRLRVLLAAAGHPAVRFHNTTPAVGATPDSLLPADPAHVAAVLRRHRPAVVVACGRHALAAVRPLWPGPLLAVPHPASRTVTNRLYRAAGRRLARGLDGVVVYRQLRDRHEVVRDG
jgi:hypothetical protein